MLAFGQSAGVSAVSAWPDPMSSAVAEGVGAGAGEPPSDADGAVESALAGVSPGNASNELATAIATRSICGAWAAG